MAYRLLSTQEIRAFPATTWLAHDLIPEGGLALLFGPSGVGKSFLALDLAHSVGTGLRWLGKQVRQGRVVYVAAGEGVSGLGQRLNAWEVAKGVPIENVVYGPDAFQLHKQASSAAFLKAIRPFEPHLVIIDTLARCFVGGKENDIQDMGLVVSAADEIRREGATVMLVHHTKRPDDEGRTHERGSGGLIAAVDVAMEIEMLGESPTNLVLKCRKQKNDAAFHPLYFDLVKAGGSLVPEV